ncbi:hypothetical protein, partial [Catenibacterium faecis]|uniref:hypothetical protein n=1 Tax=Catenibacterium faecis TaxID=2764323 RepID=UPI001EEEA394
ISLFCLTFLTYGELDNNLISSSVNFFDFDIVEFKQQNKKMIPTGGVSQLSGCCPPYGYHFIYTPGSFKA